MALLTITEFHRFAVDSFGGTIPAPLMPPTAEQAISVSGSSAASSAFNAATSMIMVHADSAMCLKFGATAPTALVGYHAVGANETRFYGVQPGSFVAAIAAS